jgi:hypothetical protein
VGSTAAPRHVAQPYNTIPLHTHQTGPRPLAPTRPVDFEKKFYAHAASRSSSLQLANATLLVLYYNYIKKRYYTITALWKSCKSNVLQWLARDSPCRGTTSLRSEGASFSEIRRRSNIGVFFSFLLSLRPVHGGFNGAMNGCEQHLVITHVVQTNRGLAQRELGVKVGTVQYCPIINRCADLT